MTGPRPVRSTRLLIVGPAGDPIRNGDGLLGVDLTGIPNTDTAAPITLAVEQYCDMGHWHRIGRTPLPAYDSGVPE